MSKATRTARYAVCVFPSLHGTPWRTDRYWVALLWFRWRSAFGFRLREVRLIDYHTGTHKVS